MRIRKEFYYMKGKGIGTYLKSFVQPEVIKGRLKTIGKLLFEKAKSIAKEVLKPALKRAAVDVGQIVSEKARQKLKDVLAPQKVESTLKNLAAHTQQPLVRETVEKLTPTISEASRNLLSNLIAGSGFKKWKPRK